MLSPNPWGQYIVQFPETPLSACYWALSSTIGSHYWRVPVLLTSTQRKQLYVSLFLKLQKPAILQKMCMSLKQQVSNCLWSYMFTDCGKSLHRKRVLLLIALLARTFPVTITWKMQLLIHSLSPPEDYMLMFPGKSKTFKYILFWSSFFWSSLSLIQPVARVRMQDKKASTLIHSHIIPI